MNLAVASTRPSSLSTALAAAIACCVVGAYAEEPNDKKSPPAAAEFFEKKIRPALVDHCYECHSARADEVHGKLMLDNRAAVLRGGAGGAVVTPGKPAASRLLTAIKYGDENLRMPPEEKLPAAVIADFEKWIAMGAVDPRDGPPPALPDSIAARATQHWAFLPPKPQSPPTVVQRDWPHRPMDYFVLAKLEAQGLEPSPAADRAALARRLYVDLTGLPPTFDQLQEFLADQRQDAYAQLVDRLFDSPHFGERWARHWLDISRFSDTKGYVFREDRNYPNAYRYRDWVIKAFQDDMPFDKFLVRQLAADCLDEKDHFAALGFVTLGRRFINNKHDIIDDRIDVVFRGMMGLTVTCARCHDHKYDPFVAADYYGLYGVFSSSPEHQDDGLPLRLKEGRPRDERIFVRGKPGNRGDIARRSFLRFFNGGEEQPFVDGSGRLELANRIADAKNPLTARVWVNRVWGHLLGRALVTTPSDFGLRTEPPLQQDVLDHLALGLVQNGWSTRWLIREITMSSVYRQSSALRPDEAKADAENQLWWRARRKRLDFESLRDAVLLVSGKLDQTVGGESVKIETANAPPRRTLYAFIDRQNLPGVFRTFDFASPDTHSPQRPHTTVPQQALFLMNNRFSMAAADAVSKSTANESDDDRRVREVYRRVLSRDPRPDELALSLAFVRQDSSSSPISPNPWQYGYGRWDGTTLSFQALPHFTGESWQGGAKLPDPKLGWVFVRGSGGHPGDENHMAIRRWVAPTSGHVKLTGRLVHPSKEADGVRGRAILKSSKKLAEWTVAHGQQPTSLETDVKAGDSLDLVVDGLSNVNQDSFYWRVEIELQPTDGRTQRFGSRAGFHGPLPQPLSDFGRLAHTLMMTNEFMFLD